MADPTYRSEVDGWFLNATRVTTAAVAVAIGALLYSGTSVTSLVGIVILVAAAALPWWILDTTSYTLTNRNLEIRSGPFHWSILLREITHIELTRKPTASPALSLDRLRIQYKSGAQVMISPENRQDFLAELRSRGVEVEVRR